MESALTLGLEKIHEISGNCTFRKLKLGSEIDPTVGLGKNEKERERKSGSWIVSELTLVLELGKI